MKRQSNRRPVNVTGFRHPGDREELARLRRLTGLDFDKVPVSLLAPGKTPADGPETVTDTRAEPVSRPARS